MSQKRSDEEFRKLLKENKPTILPLEKYIDKRTKMKFKCLTCGNEWSTFPSSVLYARSSGCRKCTVKSKTKSNNEFIAELSLKRPNITPLEPYKNAKYKMLCKCNDCGYIWRTMPNSLLTRTGCPMCGIRIQHENSKHSQEWFNNKLSEIFDGNVIPLEPYKGLDYKISCKCNLCGRTWMPQTGDLVAGKTHCPCQHSMSYGEKIVGEFLDNASISHVVHKSFADLKGIGHGYLSYDFYIEKYNLLIEYQGRQHYYPIDVFGGEKQFQVQQEHDKRKREYAEKHGINLLCIRYDENAKEVLDLWFRNNRPKPWVKIKYISKLESVETAGQSWQQAC